MFSKVFDLYSFLKEFFSSSTRREKGVALFKFFFPFLIGFLYLGFIYVFFNHEVLYPLVFAHLFPPFGKETIIPAGIALGVSPLSVALLMAFLEFIVGAFMVWNYDLLKKVPWIGKAVYNIEVSGREKLSSFGWANKFAFAAVALLVLVPFQGSGTITASITGRIIGMKSFDVWIAIVAGATTGNILIAYFAGAVIDIIGDYAFIGIVILIFIGIILYIYRDQGYREKTS